MPVLKITHFVKSDIQKTWKFFSDPANLAMITPPEMGFKIKFPKETKEMYAGMIIKYKVSPLLSIPMQWITEISHMNQPVYFVDNQVKGPFKLWHHQHHFKEVIGGIEMTDIVTYILPMGIIGEILAGWFIRKKINSIFEYRKKVIDKIFG